MRDILTPRTISARPKSTANDQPHDPREQRTREVPSVPVPPRHLMAEGLGRLHDGAEKPSAEASLGALARGCQMLVDDIKAVEAERDELLASLRELVAMYDGMDERAFWSPQTRDKVLRARATIARVTGGGNG